MPSRHTIENMQAIAKLREGKCLSKEYCGADRKLTWMCSKGHTWDAYPSIIRRGSWCPACNTKQKGTIEAMRGIAKERGGKCLSNIYINNTFKLLWQCSKGHVWKSSPHSVKDSSWCPYCYGNVKHTLQKMKQIAKERGGKCLSKTYINKESHLKWQCAKGHVWQATPGSIVNQKTWCAVCARKKMRKSTHSIEEMHRIAKQRKGRCLSKKYINVDTPLKWKCARGHIWNTIPFSILHRGSWCKQCRYIDRRIRQK
ncbi:MAG: hypothetical protein HY840_10875 [Bacteroidetes bacterium]|nr:hypothetical protein [Bacteroidota bacterium]